MRQHRVLLPDDYLYRRLDAYPGYWDRATGTVAALAFLDSGKDYPSLSLLVARRLTPPEALEYTAHTREVRALCGKAPGAPDPTAREMWLHGFGLARLHVRDVVELGLTFKPYGGHDYSQKGHADVPRGPDEAAALALRAVVMTEDDIFGP